MVKVGDKVAAEQSLITVEGDKASMEVPAPFAGTVKEIKISTGDKVKTGSLIMVFEDHDQGAGFDFIAGADFDLFDGARERRRHFHRRFVAFDGDQGLLSSHFIADFYHHFGHFKMCIRDS